eukprot:gene11357-31187_t
MEVKMDAVERFGTVDTTSGSVRSGAATSGSGQDTTAKKRQQEGFDNPQLNPRALPHLAWPLPTPAPTPEADADADAVKKVLMTRRNEIARNLLSQGAPVSVAKEGYEEFKQLFLASRGEVIELVICLGLLKDDLFAAVITTTAND